MKILQAGAAALLVAAALLIPSAAGATSAPTLTGPATAGYYAQTTLHGTTPGPNQAVTVFVARSRQRFHSVAHLQSDANGRFSWTYTAEFGLGYFAWSGGEKSASGWTSLVTASCDVSKPAFTKLPRTSTVADPKYFPDFASFTATRDGVWAGMAWSAIQAKADLIRWTARSGLQVLASFDYSHQVTYQPGEPGSVDVAGIEPDGAVVAAIQVPSTYIDRGSGRFFGETFLGSRRRALVGERGWLSEDPVGVADDGSIYGYATTGTNRRTSFLVVRWSPGGGQATVLASTRLTYPYVRVDGDGDVSYVRPASAGRQWVVRRTNGSLVALPGPAETATNTEVTAGGPGHSFYGVTGYGQYSWTVTPNSVTQTLLAPATIPNIAPDTVGPDGSFVDSDFVDESNLRTAKGAWVTTPKVVGQSNSAGFAIDSHGTLAFSSYGDGLIRFLSCR